MVETFGLISLVASLLYGLWLTHRPPSLVRTLVKTLAVGALAAGAYMADAPLLLVLALTFSALGDAFLAGDPDRWLKPGMAAFFLAHLLYVPLFLGIGAGPAEFSVIGWRLGAAIMVAAIALALLRLLWAHLGVMRYPVAGYVVAIVAMVASSLTLPIGFWLAMLGALSFMASDAILSIQLFKDPSVGGRPRLASLAIWFLYWGGQTLIVWPFVAMS